MANEWTVNPNNPDEYIYVDETGQTHTAPVYETGAKVQRSASGAVQDITFPDAEMPTAPKVRGWTDRFTDSYRQATNTGFGGSLGRFIMESAGFKKPEGMSDDQYERALVEATNRIDEKYKALNASDPAWADKDGAWDTFSKSSADILGAAMGYANPTYIVGGIGKTALGRAGSVGAVSGLEDVAQKLYNKSRGIGDGPTFEDALKVAAGGAMFHGIFGEAAPAVMKKLFGDVDVDKSIDPEALRNMDAAATAKSLEEEFGGEGLTGVVTDETPLNLTADEMLGPNNERVEITEPDESGVRIAKIIPEEGPASFAEIDHRGQIYTSDELNPELVSVIHRKVARTKAQEAKPLEEGTPPDPTKPTTDLSSRPEDPELAKAFDEEFGATSPVAEAEPAMVDSHAAAVDEPVETFNFENVVERLKAAFSSAKKTRAEQDELSRQARKEQYAALQRAREKGTGEAGFRQELAALRGEHPKVETDPLRPEFTQVEVDGLMEHFKNHPNLSGYERVRARVGLAKLLEGEALQPAEIQLLSRVFPKDMIDEILKSRSGKEKMTDIIGSTLNLPRALMSSIDLSAPFRQGWTLSTRPEFYKAMVPMVKAFTSEKYFQESLSEIRSRPTYDLMESSGLEITDLSHDFNGREENFVSKFSDKVPLVRNSARGFSGFLNKVRADVWDNLYAEAKKLGVDVEDPNFTHDLSGFVNNATGRGRLGKFEASAPFFNAVFFSPRLMSSRMALLNPIYYTRLDPFVRKQAIRDMLGASALAMTAMGTAATFWGADIEADPRSSDFGKIRVGNDRHDVLGGFGQYVTFFSRLAMNSTKTAKGEVKEYEGKGPASQTRLDAIGRFLRSKASPLAGYMGDYLAGSNIVGEPFDPVKDTRDLFIPMFANDVMKVWQEEGPENLGKLVPEFIGFGYSSYNNAPEFDRLGQQNDNEGGKMENNFFTSAPEDSHIKEEVIRLEEKNGKEIFSGVKASDVKHKKLTEEDLYNYQYYAGSFIREDLRQEMETEEWKAADDSGKIEIVKDIVKAQKANARNYLFPKE